MTYDICISDVTQYDNLEILIACFLCMSLDIIGLIHSYVYWFFAWQNALFGNQLIEMGRNY